MIYTAIKTSDKVTVVCRGEPEFVGTGSFCGWYSSEKFINCDIVGYVEDHDGYMELSIFETPLHRDELSIVSVYQSFKFEANSDDEAVHMVSDKASSDPFRK